MNKKNCHVCTFKTYFGNSAKSVIRSQTIQKSKHDVSRLLQHTCDRREQYKC